MFDRRESDRRYAQKPEVKRRMRDVTKEWRRKNPQWSSHYHMWKRYRLTPDEVARIKAEGCRICLTKEGRIHIDHNHETNEVRGGLCENCNRGIGMFKESTLLLRQAIAYLESFQ